MTKRSLSGMPFILVAAVLWASFPVLTVVAFQSLPVFTAAALTTLCSTLFFLCVLLWKPQKKKVSRQCMRDIAFACITIGCFYYTLSYVGISLTTPNNAAIVGLSEIFFSYLFISVLTKHERFIWSHVLGALLMVAGVLFVLIPSARELRLGDFIILVGGMIPPLGNLAMQRARKEASAAYIMFFRSLTGAITLGILALIFDPLPSASALWSALPAVLIGGFFLMGLSKILWIEAIHRLPITQTISVASIQPLFTMFFAYALLHQAPEWVQLLSLPPIAVGMYLLTKKPALPAGALEEV